VALDALDRNCVPTLLTAVGTAAFFTREKPHSGALHYAIVTKHACWPFQSCCRTLRPRCWSGRPMTVFLHVGRMSWPLF
jgi:hypothetical protein